MSPKGTPIFRFGEFELDPAERRLFVHGTPINLTPKVFNTLVILVEKAGHAVSKEDLMHALWPRGFVDESNLTKHIWLIRKTLGEQEHEARFIETVPKFGYRFVAPVERGPRHDNAGALNSPTKPRPPIEASATSGVEKWVAVGLAPGRGATAALVAALFLVIGAIGWMTYRPSSFPQSSTNTAGGSIAIVQFNNLSANAKDAWLAPALGQMLATELVTDSPYHVLPDELVRPARVDLAAPLAGGYSSQSLSTLRKRLGADYVLSGSYLVNGAADQPRVHLDLNLQDIHGSAVASVARDASIADLPALVAEAGEGLREKLGIAPASRGELAQVALAQPPTVDVARRIGFALDALHRYDPARARDELIDAVAEAPGYAPAYAYLAQAWSALGYKAKALTSAQQAMAHLDQLAESERLAIEAELYKAEYDWTKAAETLRQLVVKRPHDPEPRLRLIEALLEGGHPDEAQATIATLRATPEMHDDPRIELAAARAANARADPKGRAEHAEIAMRQAKARDNPGLEAEAREELGAARYDLGQYDVAEALHRQNIAYFQRIANPHGEAFSHEALANALSDHGQVERAREEYQRALALYQHIGDLSGQASSYDNIATALWTAGDGDGAQRATNDALALVRQTGDLNRQAWNLNALATMESDTDASDAAGEHFREAIALARKAGRPAAWYLSAYTGYLELRGQLADALKECAAAREDARSRSDSQLLSYAESQCAAVELDSGEVDEAIASYKRSQATATTISDHYFDAVAALSLGQIQIGRRRWPEAVEPLQHAIDVFAASEDAGGEANAQGLIALARAALEQRAESEQAIVRARNLRARINQKQQVFVVDLALTLLQGQVGDRQAAVVQLNSMAADAEARHWVSLALEARLAALQLLPIEDERALTLHKNIESAAKRGGFKWLLTRMHDAK